MPSKTSELTEDCLSPGFFTRETYKCLTDLSHDQVKAKI